MTNTLDTQTHQLAAMAYGEASTENNIDEMFAIASVLVRQRDARGYIDIAELVRCEHTFSYVVNDGNHRYKRVMNASVADINKDYGMQIAVAAAKNALAGGVDKSNGVYFWDGGDIKINYSTHQKVLRGIKFTDPAHNIYHIKESESLAIAYAYKRARVNGIVAVKKKEIGRYNHVYYSTAAYGGTIFWKFNPKYVEYNHSKEYK